MSIPQLNEYYNPDDDSVDASNPAKRCEQGDIVLFARQYSTTLPPGLLVGIAERETDYKYNECDTDYNDDGSVKKKTYGLFQMTVGEVSSQLVFVNPLNPAKSICDIETSVKAACSLFKKHTNRIISAANDSPTGIKIDAGIPMDVWPYLCWLHNAGEESIDSINKYGLDWNATLVRNTNNYYVQNKLRPYATRVLDLVQQFPLDLWSGEIDSSDTITTPLGDFEAYDQRLIIACCLGLLLIYLASRYHYV